MLGKPGPEAGSQNWIQYPGSSFDEGCKPLHRPEQVALDCRRALATVLGSCYPHSLSPAPEITGEAGRGQGAGAEQSMVSCGVCSLGLFPDSHLTVSVLGRPKQGEGLPLTVPA